MKPLVLIPLLFFLAACGKYSIRNIDNPTPRPDYGGWMKPDGSIMTDLEGKRAFLECGDPSPSMNRFIEEKALGITNGDESHNYSSRSEVAWSNQGSAETPAGEKVGH